jgi:hypothetical protein
VFIFIEKILFDYAVIKAGPRHQVTPWARHSRSKPRCSAHFEQLAERVPARKGLPITLLAYAEQSGAHIFGLSPPSYPAFAILTGSDIVKRLAI